MQNRFLSMLTIGGVTVLCLAPNIVRAEDGVTPPEMRLRVRTLSNINDAVEKAVEIEDPELAPPTAVLGIQPAIKPAIKPATKNEERQPGQYRPLVDSIAHDNSVDPDLIDAMIRTESNYNPLAVSSKGARGLMQLIPETGRRFGVTDFFDPKQNIEGGVRYVRYLLDMFDGDLDLSLAAYNAGENLVAKIGRIPSYPETQNYVRKIRSVYAKSSTDAMVSKGTIGPGVKPEPVLAHIGIPESTSSASLRSNGKINELSSAPISYKLDERGVHHFSNLEPEY